MTTKTSSPNTVRRWLLRLVAVAMPTLGVAMASCSTQDASLGSPGGGGDVMVTGGGGTASMMQPDCTDPRHPGCACDTEGQHIVCGEVIATIHGQKMCGKGFSVCTNGKWAECVIDNAVQLIPDTPPGYDTKGLGPASPCSTNPCDPYCITFPDDPSGITDAGSNLLVDDAGLSLPDTGAPIPCTPSTCAKQAKNCGTASDLCGGTLNCGTCTLPQTCGGLVPGQCGVPVPPGGPCVPKTCAQQGKNCGPVSDTCGGVLNCGSCMLPAECGGAGNPSVCGISVPPGGPCVPKTCAQLGKNCGPVSDTCGGLLNCGTCTGAETCGGGTIPSVCGVLGSTCVKKTCAQVGKDCGPVSDGCGGLLDCGTCQAPTTCGGAGVPSVCGTNAACTNLCLKQMSCGGTNTTSITGTVYAPNGTDPLPNAIVYVPNAPVPAFVPGVSCDNCLQVAGSPLVSTTTAVDGTFTLKNMPVGANIPLVIQIGRWRRQITIPNVASCVNTNVSAACTPSNSANCPTRFPRTKAEGDIPKMAFVTGQVDSMECVWRKIGIADSEFTNPNGTGRINFFAGGLHPGTYINYYGSAPGTPNEATLLSNPALLDEYDIVLFPCQGAQYSYGSPTHGQYQTNLANYANAGGRVFATHFSYVWLYGNTGPYQSPLSSAINWNINQGSPSDQTGYINQSFPKGMLLAQWLKLPAIGASATLGQIGINTLRHDFNVVNAPNQNWMTINSPNAELHATFNTPLGVPAASQCGRVVFSDFHVENAGNTQFPFPSECNNAGMTPQEKMLEFMLFDLASCVTPDVPPPCAPITCAQQGVTCGKTGDGCGGTITCGAACIPPPCQPITCAQQGLSCGQAGDGCGGILSCGNCTLPQTCGGGGTPGQCGMGPPCVPTTCAAQGLGCGPAGDGCGNTLDCGTCVAPTTCGGGGVHGQCGMPPPCVPITCAAQSIGCGKAGDGCGGTIDCGTCVAPLTCGGGGTPGQCGIGLSYNEGWFVRDYDGSSCPTGTSPQWSLWSWNATTANDSHIDFSVQTAPTLAGLSAAPIDPILFSNPPGPAALAGQNSSAHGANHPPGSPDTELGSASVDNTFVVNNRLRHNGFVRVTSHLVPSLDKQHAPLLTSWNLQMDCVPSE